MTKKIITLAFAIIATVAVYAQTPFSVYTPVQVDPRTMQQVQPRYNQPKPENFQQINGYYINNQGRFQKIRLKINVVSDREVYVRGYYYNSHWYDMNTSASAVRRGMDADVICENFDWKCYLMLVGWVYF